MEKKIIGPFVLRSVIGEGTFASVYLAIHSQTHRVVALKCIEKSNTTDDFEKVSIKGKNNISNEPKNDKPKVDHKLTNSIASNGVGNNHQPVKSNEGPNKIGNSIGKEVTISTPKYSGKKEIVNNHQATFKGEIKGQTNKPVFNKTYENSTKKDEQYEQFRKEVSIMKTLDHPNIITLYNILEDDKFLFLAMEYVSCGSLLAYINSHGPLSEKEAARIIRQLFSAVEYLHNEAGVIHRDIKAENILLDHNMNIRLIDFGLSRRIPHHIKLFKTACGSTAYASPELVSGQPYSVQSDIWSIGVVLYAMMTGTLPFFDSNMKKISDLILHAEPKYPRHFSAPLVDLLKRLLHKNPMERITLEEVKNHEFVKDIPDYGSLKLFNGDSPDASVTEKLKSMQIPCENLENDLKNYILNDSTMIYKILRREIVTDELRIFGTEKLPKLKQQNEHSSPAVPRMNVTLTRAHASPNSKSIHNKLSDITVLTGNQNAPVFWTRSPLAVPKIRMRTRIIPVEKNPVPDPFLTI
ncbi:CAMK family protein kinase [Tritrichomonas foetus]|uniref:CAMK family protein kinase n=1 Tax=Tritrichomonas foetus TaxID=1144522 RepID=A0A1J4J545_9EUKA|nr:CAMK family protein kinase [Tritrichomonas foetus]|eukprot:OHS93271.1 CAMK family protein kinase [Tritrichomonas foetus]